MGERINKDLCRKIMGRAARYVALVKLNAPAEVIGRELELIRQVHPALSTGDFLYCVMNFHQFQEEDERARAAEIQRDQDELDDMTLEEMMELGDED